MFQGYAAARSLATAPMAKKTDDLIWCEHCWDRDNVYGWLCNECRRTDVSILAWTGAGICRNCPALQRFQGGRTKRKVLSDACDPEQSAKMWSKAKKTQALHVEEELQGG